MHISTEKRFNDGKGNFTRGKSRRGYRGGRVPLHPPGTLTEKVGAVLSIQEYCIARYLGAGNVSKGIGLALNAVSPFLRGPVPNTRADAWSFTRTHKSHCINDTRDALALIANATRDLRAAVAMERERKQILSGKGAPSDPDTDTNWLDV